MPHPDNSNWMSLLMGQPVKLDPPTSVDEIPARRLRFDLTMANLDPLPDVASAQPNVPVRERRDGSTLTADVYVPHGEGPFPVVLYLHGSMYCLASAWDFRKLGRRYCENGFVVAVLDYALAPERPFPWALEDSIYAARWLTQHAHEYGGDASRLFVCGDSAGANLSGGAMAFLTGNRGHEIDEGDLAGVPVSFAGSALFYGIFDWPLLMHEPYSNGGSIEVMGNQAYLGPHYLKHHRDPLVSPALADVSGFPPTFVTCGAEDSFLGQSLSMGKALAMANVPVTLSLLQGADHSFAFMEHLLPQAHEEMERVFTWLRRTAGLEGWGPAS